MPERPDGFGSVVEEVLEQSRMVQRGRIGIPLSIIAEIGYPIARLTRVDHLKGARRIKVGAPCIIQDTIIVAFNPYDNVRLPGGQIWISWISSAEFDCHTSRDPPAFHFNFTDSRMFIPMILESFSPEFDHGAALLDPSRLPTSISSHQKTDIPNPLSSSNHSGLSQCFIVEVEDERASRN
jgi:hypothetical protein